ncbi:MAG TPA: glutathione peroxidase [Alphaproteobacteria bacterium]
MADTCDRIGRRRVSALLLGAIAAAISVPIGVRSHAVAAGGDGKARTKRTSMAAHDFDFVSIDGEALPMRNFGGKAVLVVNTASFCGFTPQYADLEKLWQRYKDRGLVVLGVPSNDFGGQEPGTASEIKAFCETYAVSFPLTEKQKVVGPEAHPFYRWVAAELGEAGVPRWNFHKYLIDPSGEIVGAWPSRVTPLSREVTDAVEQALPR